MSKRILSWIFLVLMIVCAIGSLTENKGPRSIDAVLIFVFGALYVATSIGADIAALRERGDITKADDHREHP